MNIRPLIALTFLLALVGCSVDEHAGGHPFEMKGFYPGMPVAEFVSLAESYGGRDESGQRDWKKYTFSDDNFTLGGLRVHVVAHSFGDTDATGSIEFFLHEDTPMKDFQRLREILMKKYGDSVVGNEDSTVWRTKSDQFDDALWWFRGDIKYEYSPSVTLMRVASNEQKQSELKTDPENF